MALALLDVTLFGVDPGFREALATRPDDADARFNLGVLLAASGRHQEAAAELERAAGAYASAGNATAERDARARAAALRRP